MLDERDLPPQIPVTEEMRLEIQGAIAEIDPAQMAIISKMTPAERMEMGFRMSDMALRVARERLMQLHPELSEVDANRTVLERYYALEKTDHVRSPFGD